MFFLSNHTECDVLLFNRGNTHLMVFLPQLIGGFRQREQPHRIKRTIGSGEAKDDC